MDKILFVGPISTTGGPAIKNRILISHLQRNATIKVWNTYDRSLRARIGAVISILFTKQKYIIISVSRKGRNLLYPLVLFKHKFSKCHFSLVVIGGNIVKSVKTNGERKAFSKADLVTTETEGIKRELEKAFSLSNTFYMPNYKERNGDIPKTNPESFFDPEMKLLFLSNMYDKKGVGTLLEAYKRIREMGLQVKLDYYGPILPGMSSEILTDIEKTEGVQYLGEIENSKVLSVMSSYHVFVFPTEHLTEGFPAVLVEALTVGLPVIASDVNYNGEIIRDGINGLIFPRENVESLKEKIEWCLSHREELREMSLRNRTESERYDAETVVGSYAEKLRELGWPV